MLARCQRERFLLKEWKVVVLYRPRPRLHHLLSSPRSFLYLTPPHNQPLGLLSFLSAVHLSFFLFTLPVTSHPSPSPSPLLSSSLPPSVSLSLTSLMSEDGGSHGCTELPTPSAHDFGVCVLSSRVSPLSHGRVHVLPCFINTWETLSFSLPCLLPADQTSRGDVGKASHAGPKRA